MPSIDLFYYSIEEYGLPLSEAQILAVLNNEERERYQRFLRPEPKKVFGHARYLLKTLISGRTGLDALDLAFRFNDKGKPYLPDSCGLFFNLSHCNSAIAIALSDIEVGVDVEMLNHRGDPWRNPADFLNPAIAAQLESCAPELQQACFYRYWTALEAFTKSRGKSIFENKDEFALDAFPEELSKIYSHQGSNIHLFQFKPADQLALAYSANEPIPVQVNIVQNIFEL